MKTPLFCITVASSLLAISLLEVANNLQAAEDSAAFWKKEREIEVAAFKKQHLSLSLCELQAIYDRLPEGKHIEVTQAQGETAWKRKILKGLLEERKEADFQAFKARHASMTLDGLRKKLEELRREFLKQLIEHPTADPRLPLDHQPFLERLVNEKEGEEFRRHYESFEDKALLKQYVKNFTGKFITEGGTRFAEENIAYAEIIKRGLDTQLTTQLKEKKL